MEHHPDARRHGKTILAAAAILTCGGIALHWGWNTFAVELLAQRQMQFRHALGLEILLLGIAGAFLIASRLFGARPR